MATVIVPLVKEPIQILTGYFFKSQTQLLRFTILVFIGVQVQIQRFKKCTITHIVAQHLQYASAFIIAHSIKYIFLAIVMKTHQVLLLTIAVVISLERTIAFCISFIFAILEFIPQL